MAISRLLPDDSQRHFIAGRTGSGKSTEALHHISQRSFDQMPWIMVDFKGGDLLAACPVNAVWSVYQPPPTVPGLYYIRCDWEEAEPGGPLESFMLACLEQGGIGIMIDEGAMLKNRHRGLRAYLTRGRSKLCPLIFCTQRPMDIDTYALSESEYLQFFLLDHPDDYERIEKWVPRERLNFDTLPGYGDFHSFWYDKRTREVTVLKPAPKPPEIMQRILTRLPRWQDEPTPELPRRIRV